ncbi:MAG TPA: hypothetical protein VGS97_01450 [Actinocrinis sp.]|uniref:hypothetical protein n=1 Tax=Actinocrinis sp. TaxID=1920516 RepID=UPI002DDCAB2F|nr:hypothetical protein [Actinocrinis sp.]HEV2342731.1 hypothetical protein [Actinocrinis sp.]
MTSTKLSAAVLSSTRSVQPVFDFRFRHIAGSSGTGFYALHTDMVLTQPSGPGGESALRSAD